MAESAFIYKNIRIYRLCMNLLYKGSYRQRFAVVNKLIKGTSVTELCFGDIITANYCKKNNISWKGYDINKEFTENAIQLGFDAVLADVSKLNEFAKAETCIITGSLYHFHHDPESLLRKMLLASPHLIISEPIFNLSSGSGIIGKLARSSANVEGSEQSFRYTEKTLLTELQHLSGRLKFTFRIRAYCSKDIIIEINK